MNITPNSIIKLKLPIWRRTHEVPVSNRVCVCKVTKITKANYLLTVLSTEAFVPYTFGARQLEVGTKVRVKPKSLPFCNVEWIETNGKVQLYNAETAHYTLNYFKDKWTIFQKQKRTNKRPIPIIINEYQEPQNFALILNQLERQWEKLLKDTDK